MDWCIYADLYLFDSDTWRQRPLWLYRAVYHGSCRIYVSWSLYLRNYHNLFWRTQFCRYRGGSIGRCADRRTDRHPNVADERRLFCNCPLGIGEAIRIIIQNLTGITGGARGLQGIPSGSPAWMVAVVLVTVVVFLANFKRSKLGRNCIAIREEPLAAAACGIDVFRHKLLAMAISCALCGLSGALLAHYMHYLVPTMFNMAKSNELIMTAILGGRGSITGTLIAGAVLIPLPEFLRFGSAQEWRMVLYGLLVVITIIFRPTGLVGGKEITPKAIRQFGMQMRQRLHRMNGVVRKGDGEHE